MPHALWLADVAASTGCVVAEYPDWETRGSFTFSPGGVVWHHTATPASSKGDYPTLNLIVNGRSDLPGPLANYGLGRSGTIYVIAAGKANHAGSGGWKGLVGNASVIGIEAEHPGTKGTPWPAEQLDAYRRLTAAICLELGVGADMVCGHKEWAPTRKIDPIDLNMTSERAAVAALMEDDMAEAKIAKPDWLPQSDIQKLLDFGVLTSQPTAETIDFWRQLALMARLVKNLPASGTVGPPGPRGPAGPSPKSATFAY